jgi:two-component system phosphate regulon sensor histidine kinase PhoR
MAVPDLLRALTGASAAAVAGSLSFALGAPVAAAMLTALIACVGTWMALGDPAHASIPIAEEPTPPAAPDMGELIETTDDPLILVERQLVVRANLAARNLLGAHIVGEDMRLAIRHPAAAERLAIPSAIETAAPVELAGLGDRERRWEMFVHELSGGTRLVRLRDRTGTYVAERMRVDFVANASHELRTPLATLLGFIETLQDQNAAEDIATRSRFLKIMFGEAKRMQQLVDDLISLSRIEAEKFRPPQDALDLAALIEDVEVAIRSGRPDDASRLLVETDTRVLPVAGDHIQLAQLLHNLIGNALKYGRSGTPVRITLSNAPRGMVRLSIADEGDGIAPEHLPRLTERFYRVDPGRSRALGGTGLGLAIVKHIVERHRGRLDIESEVGRGTTVSVLLPVAGEALS